MIKILQKYLTSLHIKRISALQKLYTCIFVTYAFCRILRITSKNPILRGHVQVITLLHREGQAKQLQYCPRPPTSDYVIYG